MASLRLPCCRMFKWASSKAAGERRPEAYPLGYVEDLVEPRTKLEARFNILLMGDFLAAQINLSHTIVRLYLLDGPSQMTVPSCKTVTIRAICRTNSMSCSITMIACFSANDWSNWPVCSVSLSVIPATGSSTRSNDGSCKITMPISSHCF